MKLRIRTERLSHETLDGEVIIVDQVSGAYYSLTGAGAEIWQLLASPRSVDEIAAALTARTGADAAEVRQAVAQLADQLRAETLVVAADGEANAPDQGAPFAWVAPRLDKFTDLESLVLLDPIHDVDDQAGWPHAAPPAGPKGEP